MDSLIIYHRPYILVAIPFAVVGTAYVLKHAIIAHDTPEAENQHLAILLIIVAVANGVWIYLLHYAALRKESWGWDESWTGELGV